MSDVLVAQVAPVAASSNHDLQAALVGGVVAAALSSVVTLHALRKQLKHDRVLRTEALAQDRELRTMELDHDRVMKREERTYDRMAETYVDLARYLGEVNRYLDELRARVQTEESWPSAPAEVLGAEWFSTTVARTIAYATDEVRLRLANFVNQTHQVTKMVTVVDNAAAAARADPMLESELSTVTGMMGSAFQRASLAANELADAINHELRIDLDEGELPPIHRWL